MSSPRWTRWGLAYVGCFGVSWLLATLPGRGGDVAFLVGALTILASVGFIGTGGEKRMKVVRNMMGVPVAKEEVDPVKRAGQISTGLKVFLLGLVIWVPLLFYAFW